MHANQSEAAKDLPSQTQQENELLVVAIAGGDRDAERDFAVRFLPRVRAMLLARSRDADLTADLQQDVMLAAICALRRGQLREAAKLPSFVLAIARNILNSHYRGAARQPELLEFPDLIPDLTPVVDHLEAMQQDTLAANAIASLEPLDRSILQMTLVEGLKPGMIAKRLHLSSEVVRQRKLRATRRVVDFVQNQSQKDSPVYFMEGRNP